MPIALLLIGVVLAIAAYNNTADMLTAQLKKDLSGKTGFVYWIAAIVIVGSLGFIKTIEPVSRMMLALVLLVMFLSNKGVFQQFNAALASGGDAAGETKPANGDKETAGAEAGG